VACPSSGLVAARSAAPNRERTFTDAAGMAPGDCHAAAGRAAPHLPAVRLPAQPVQIALRVMLPAVPFIGLVDGELVDMRLCC
jgi:hypothetical protein